MAMPPEFRQIPATSEDALDAAVSALVMAASVEKLLGLRREPDYASEGRMGRPGHWPRQRGDIVEARAE